MSAKKKKRGKLSKPNNLNSTVANSPGHTSGHIGLTELRFVHLQKVLQVMKCWAGAWECIILPIVSVFLKLPRVVQCMGGSTTFTIFQLLLGQCTVRPPIDNILFLHRFLSCDSSDCCIGLPSKSLIKPLKSTWIQIKSANLCFTEVEGVSLQQARIAVNPLHSHLRRREDATRLKPLSVAEGVDEQQPQRSRRTNASCAIQQQQSNKIPGVLTVHYSL